MEKKLYDIFSKLKMLNLVRPPQGFLAHESLWPLRPFWIAILPMFSMPFVATEQPTNTPQNEHTVVMRGWMC